MSSSIRMRSGDMVISFGCSSAGDRRLPPEGCSQSGHRAAFIQPSAEPTPPRATQTAKGNGSRSAAARAGRPARSAPWRTGCGLWQVLTVADLVSWLVHISESVADTWFGLQQACCGTELLAEVPDINAEVLRILDMRRAPNRGQQLTVSDDPSLHPDQDRQQVPLARREPQRFGLAIQS